jgi:hypothetical protein
MRHLVDLTIKYQIRYAPQIQRIPNNPKTEGALKICLEKNHGDQLLF